MPALIPADSAPPPEDIQTQVISVRRLVEFSLQEGDLTPGGFQRRDRAQLGTQGHRRVQRSRPAGYETEVEVAYRVHNGLTAPPPPTSDHLSVVSRSHRPCQPAEGYTPPPPPECNVKAGRCRNRRKPGTLPPGTTRTDCTQTGDVALIGNF
jgi:hypothetical protein